MVTSHSRQTLEAPAVGRPEIRPRVLPNLIIVGAMKAGTTTLHHWLDQHPDVSMSRVKEPNFFLADPDRERSAWYARQFDARARVRGESSTSYTKHPARPGVPERIHRLVPDARLVYILRDPIERTVSHYQHAVQRGREPRSLADAVSDLSDDNHYIGPSRYAMQLGRYLDYFPMEAIFVTTLEELRRSPQATLAAIVLFAGLPRFEFRTERIENVAERHGQSTRIGHVIESYRAKRLGRRLPRPVVRAAKLVNARLSRPAGRPVVQAAVRRHLEDGFRPDVANLRAMTGLAFADWSV